MRVLAPGAFPPRTDSPTRESAEIRTPLEHRQTCGCRAAAAAMLSTAGVVVIWWAFERHGRFVLWPELGLALAAVVGVGTVGKAGALGAAQGWMLLQAAHARHAKQER